eukprot:Nitzschia sp. Nitz4//scaffold171_size48012//2061//3106//NITZ4_007116-RA/size48012-augustus-gene-0.1-mRNA-1//1//CDS//3329538674//4246//frame0
MDSNSVALIGTGLGLGVVHVLTGPDHLGALATLSSGADGCTSFSLGIRWGIGHSTGLLVVGIVLIVRDLSESDDRHTIDMPDSWSHLFEYIVGVAMLCLGTYGIIRAFRLRNTDILGSHASPALAQNGWYCSMSPTMIVDEEEASFRDNQTERDPMIKGLEDSVYTHSYYSSMEHDTDTESQDVQSEDSESTGASHSSMMIQTRTSGQRLSAQVLALCAGVVHGLAGPGGVLGVIPAVQLHDWKLAAVYLSSFCMSSTVTMGCFAYLYGNCSSNIGKRSHVEFHIHCFSSALSILVGITWLTLLEMGKLEDVFP